MLMRELAVTELHDCDKRHLDLAAGGGTPGSNQSISEVCVKLNSISSTSLSVPTVRLTGTSLVSGGLASMKWYL
jgi:hypothetical protein